MSYCQLLTCDWRNVLGSQTSSVLHIHKKNTCDSLQWHGSYDACRRVHGHETSHRTCTRTPPVSDWGLSVSVRRRSLSASASDVHQNYNCCQFQCQSFWRQLHTMTSSCQLLHNVLIVCCRYVHIFQHITYCRLSYIALKTQKWQCMRRYHLYASPLQKCCSLGPSYSNLTLHVMITDVSNQTMNACNIVHVLTCNYFSAIK